MGKKKDDELERKYYELRLSYVLENPEIRRHKSAYRTAEFRGIAEDAKKTCCI